MCSTYKVCGANKNKINCFCKSLFIFVLALNLKIAEQNRDSTSGNNKKESDKKDKKSKKKKSKNRKRSSSTSSSDSSDSSDSSTGSSSSSESSSSTG